MVFERLCQFLSQAGLAYETIEHLPAITSAAAAQARGTQLHKGAKALLMQIKGRGFALFVLPANCSIDSAAVRRHLGVSRLRFARTGELLELTGLVPGCVPPFGEPLMPYPLFIDASFGEREDAMVFTAGRLDRSISLSVPDYLGCAGGELFAFAC